MFISFSQSRVHAGSGTQISTKLQTISTLRVAYVQGAIGAWKIQNN